MQGKSECFLCIAGFPRNPSEYASLAAQTVIGQVLEAVAPLSEDAHVQALTVTMTAFMEAWMEHILRQKIKFRLGFSIFHWNNISLSTDLWHTEVLLPVFCRRNQNCVAGLWICCDSHCLLQRGIPCFCFYSEYQWTKSHYVLPTESLMFLHADV